MRIEKDQMLTLGAVVMAAVVFVFAVWMPSRARSAELGDRQDAAKAELGLAPNADAERTRLETEVIALRERVNGAQQKVPERDEIAEVVRGINQSLKKHGVTQQEMVTRKASRFAHYSTIPITIEYQSSFPVVFGALKQIERMPRLIRVDRLSVQGDADNAAAPLEVHMQLSTFYTRSNGGR